MNEKTRKGLVYSSLILALVWAYFNFSGPKKDKAGSPGKTVRTEVVRKKQPINIQTSVNDSIYSAYKRKPWGKNPFYSEYRPTGGSAVSQKVELHLLGVLFREYRAHALINNHIVAVGDELEGFRVTEITRDSVVLDNGETIVTLRVTKESS